MSKSQTIFSATFSPTIDEEIVKIELPTGFFITEVDKIFVSAGDRIRADDTIISAFEDVGWSGQSYKITSPLAGVVTEININLGDEIEQRPAVSIISLRAKPQYHIITGNTLGGLANTVNIWMDSTYWTPQGNPFSGSLSLLGQGHVPVQPPAQTGYRFWCQAMVRTNE
jgi:hypothetical protein